MEIIDRLENLENLNRLESKNFREARVTTEPRKSIKSTSLNPRDLGKNWDFRKSTKCGGFPDQKKFRASRN